MRFAMLAAALLMVGCGTIGHSQNYMLQTKKELLDYYEEKESDSNAAKRSDARKLRDSASRAVGLRKVYGSNVPISVTDFYDVRTADTQIRPPDPLNIIINKVRVKENKQRPWLFENSADVAVVVTVDDGKKQEPKHVIVSYVKNVGKGTELPTYDLLAYSTSAYADEPVRIEVTVLALYGARNKLYTEILTSAAGIGASLSPAYAPAISVAAQVGKALINSKEDNVIARFTFQLYPWPPPEKSLRNLDHLGVPRVSAGSYLLVNAEAREDIPDPGTISLDYNFRPYRAPVASKAAHDDLAAGKIPPWPVVSEVVSPAQPLDLTYVVLTVDKTKVSEAQEIINRADAANRAVAQLAADAVPTLGQVQFVSSQLDDVKSKIRLQAVRGQFNRLKEDPPIALNHLLVAHADKTNGLSPDDRAALLQDFRNMIPPNVSVADRADEKTLGAWLTKNGGELIYFGKTGRYCIRKVEDDGRIKCKEGSV